MSKQHVQEADRKCTAATEQQGFCIRIFIFGGNIDRLLVAEAWVVPNGELHNMQEQLTAWQYKYGRTQDCLFALLCVYSPGNWSVQPVTALLFACTTSVTQLPFTLCRLLNRAHDKSGYT